MVELVTCMNKEEPIKDEGARVVTIFLLAALSPQAFVSE